MEHSFRAQYLTADVLAEISEDDIYFLPNKEFMTKSTFVCKSDDNYINNRKFTMKVPCYLWDLPVDDILDKEMCLEEQASTYINMYLKQCSKDDSALLINKTHYLRVMQYQDGPNANRYCYMYVRDINNCTYENNNNKQCWKKNVSV